MFYGTELALVSLRFFDAYISRIKKQATKNSLLEELFREFVFSAGALNHNSGAVLLLLVIVIIHAVIGIPFDTGPIWPRSCWSNTVFL